ncbi:cytochrome P450 89A2-like [Mangifera indica]|uniref:cytochrome P450 89A2-like n=1 Tax=Mangifera indica TaxID=29780 RepID=UPI001CFB3E49|nr:cytochrome P450 89A2-like [Mangifera indica]
METWFIILCSLSVSALIKAFFNLRNFNTKNSNHKLPPGPSTFPIISNLLLLRKSTLEIRSIIRSLHTKLGPIISLQINSKPAIFVADRSLAHEALIQNGAVFADRPPPSAVGGITGSNQHNINSAAYGPNWRLFRRNLTAEILHPSRVKSYSHARKWVLQILLDCLNSQSKSGEPVRLIDHFQYAMFCLLVLMCFGDKLDNKKIKEVEYVQRRMMVNLSRFRILNFWPRLTKILFYKRWKELLQFRKEQYEVLMPLIRERRKMKLERLEKAKHDLKEVNGDYVLAYVDTLFDLELPEEKRKLDENEILSLSTEFLGAGTDTTSTALQWVMANLVKYPHIQEKLLAEIKGVVGDEQREVKEDDLQKMPYLKAIILESLRRHPPAQFVVPHAVTEDVILNGFLVPKNASINFMVADMGWDPNVWEDPMEFKPERFLNNEEVFDITGSREIKMMPFGVGRRICPGLGLAMLHLEYFVANLIWYYEWKAVQRDEVNLEEKVEFTMVMKYPLKAHLNPRFK